MTYFLIIMKGVGRWLRPAGVSPPPRLPICCSNSQQQAVFIPPRGQSLFQFNIEALLPHFPSFLNFMNNIFLQRTTFKCHFLLHFDMLYHDDVSSSHPGTAVSLDVKQLCKNIMMPYCFWMHCSCTCFFFVTFKMYFNHGCHVHPIFRCNATISVFCVVIF